MGWKPWPSHPHQAPHQAHLARHPPNYFGTLVCGTESTRIQKDGKRQHALNALLWSGSIRMEIAYSVCRKGNTYLSPTGSNFKNSNDPTVKEALLIPQMDNCIGQLAWSLSPSLLAFLRTTERSTLGVSVQDKQIVCILLQDKLDRPAPPWISHKIKNNAEHAYDTTHSECLAVIWAIILLTLFPEASQLSIRTDLDALTCILDRLSTTGMFSPWQLRMSVF